MKGDNVAPEKADNMAADDGDDKTDSIEPKVEADVKEGEKKQIVTSELRKLQFYGAGPKTALPDAVGSGNYYYSLLLQQLQLLR